MAKPLTNPITRTNIIHDVEITAAIINYEEGFTEVHYITLLEDGTPYQRGHVRDTDINLLNKESLFARVLSKLEE